MSAMPPGDPGTSGLSAGYSAGAPPGLPTSPDDRYPAGIVDSRARNALILGILGILPLSVLAGIPAIVVGTRALRHIEASDGAVRGRGIAWCGIVLGCLSVLVLVVALVAVYG